MNEIEQEAKEILGEVNRLLFRAREAFDARRYVEAEGWMDRLKAVVNDQDVFTVLATYEAHAGVGGGDRR
jgi:hypothetical protein